MQALDARAQYRNSLHCAYRIFTEEGVLRFWTGTTPRLARLVVRLPLFLACCCPKTIWNVDERRHCIYHL